MRLLIAAFLLAISYAQTGFCVQRYDCQVMHCNTQDRVFCPCTCVPGTINSNVEHFTSTFGSTSVTDSGPISDNTGVEVVVDAGGNGGSGNAGSVQPSQPPKVTYVLSKTGYICEEQDLELMHFPYFPGQLQSIQQCAENVARAPLCSQTFFSGVISGTCGCVKTGFRCAENEGNDQHADVNIYTLTSGSPFGANGAPYSGAMPGLPSAGMHPWMHPEYEHPEYEHPEAEDLFPFGYHPHAMAQGGFQPHKLSKSASLQTAEKKSSTGVSMTVLVLCATIPALVGFLVGLFILRSKSGSNPDLTNFQQMTA